MEVGKLNVEFRGNTGKTQAKSLRKVGKIPAIVYGGGGEPLALSLESAALLKSLDPVKKTNTVLTLTVAGAPEGSSTLTVMLRDYQKDAIRGDVTHADFIRVDLNKPVHANVPVILVGKSEGVKNGGIMHQVIRTLAIACTPDKIPAKLEVDITNLGMNEALHVSDVKLGEGVKALADGGSTICAVTAPKAEKEAAATEAAPAEGAAAAAPAAGAAKEGDKAAAGGDKKPAAAPAKK